MSQSLYATWRIRPYIAGDRPVLRRICCDTADAGQPLETFFDDRKLAADILMNYYTDFEPESLLVVEQDGAKGYLAGCCDTRRFVRTMIRRIVPLALFKAFWRGTWWAASTRRLIRWNLPFWRRLRTPPTLGLANYPAHLHINLYPGIQGQGIGHQLIERFLVQLRARGIRGVHLSVREDNIGAITFFERNGFRRLGRRLFMQFGPGADAIRYSVIMVKLVK